MLACISGSQGTGKTTVINSLKDLGYEKIGRKTARSVLSESKANLQDIYKDYQRVINFQDVLKARKKYDESDDLTSKRLIFTERSCLDLLTYSILHVGHIIECNNWLNEYARDCIQWHKKYDKVIYLLGGRFKIENDGVRVSNKFYANSVNLTLLHLIKKYTDEEKLLIIDTNDHDIRIEKILKFIKS